MVSRTLTTRFQFDGLTGRLRGFDVLSAEGYSPDFEFYPVKPACRSVGVDGLDDEISFHVANVHSDEEAITRVHQALSLLASKSRRKIRRDAPSLPS